MKEPTAVEALADEHPLKKGTVIEQNHYLYLERADDREIFYDVVSIHEDIDRSINIFAQSTNHWTACEGPSIIDLQTNSKTHNSFKYMAIPTIQEPDSYGAAPRPFENEYWIDHFGFDDAAIRLYHQGRIDALADFNIYAKDLYNIRAPLRPRSMYATPVDYEKYQPNFYYIPIQRVIDTFKHTTQNMVLPPSSFLRRRFKSFWPFMNFPR